MSACAEEAPDGLSDADLGGEAPDGLSDADLGGEVAPPSAD